MRVRLTSQAHRELERIGEFLIERSPATARGLVSALDAVFSRLRQMPYHGRATTKPAVRYIILPRYPFKVFYRVVGDTIEVLSIFHTSQAPDRELE